MHAHEQVDVRDIFGVHVDPGKLAVGLTQELDELHVVDLPGPVDEARLEGFVVRLLNKAPGIEALHRTYRLTKISTVVVLDYSRKLK